MKNKKALLIAISLCLSLFLGGCTYESNGMTFSFNGNEAEGNSETMSYNGASETEFEYWNPSSNAMQSIISYVEDVTDPSSDSFVEEGDRIAVFDLDGTLIGERFPTYIDQCLMLHRYLHDPSFEPDPETREYMLNLENALLNGLEKPSAPKSSGEFISESFKGFTVEEYRSYVRDFLKSDIPGFKNMTYGERFFKPMVSFVRYLSENDFRVFICSGAECSLLREIVAGSELDPYIPSERIIGTTYSLTATNQGDTAGRDYIYELDDSVLMDGAQVLKNLGMNKVVNIVNIIGKAPTLAVGNSSGDFAMAEYTVQNGGKAYMLLCDDTERDYGSVESATKFKASCDERGFETISMRDEFDTIYGYEVEKVPVETEKISPANEAIENWSADSPAMASIVKFVSDSVSEGSPGFIPKADRIAVFDMDGTLYGERAPTYFNDWLFINRALYDEDYKAPAKLRNFAKEWEDKVLRGVPMDNFDERERKLGPQLYKGLTPDSYADVVRKFKAMPVWGFDGMTYGEAYFQPMVSLVKYLKENDYSVYIVSATYRDAVRVMTEGVLDEYVPYDRVIGTDLLYEASGDRKKDSMFYELTPNDSLQIDGRLFIKNQKTNKATAIQREIGKVPVLCFGNSTGDFSMATYTLQNEKYASQAYMLLCDDTERDYGDPEAAAAFKEKCDQNGFITISEKDEFAILFKEGAKINKDAQTGTETEASEDANSGTEIETNEDAQSGTESETNEDANSGTESEEADKAA
ncbi:MAG: haloacid dehalogenase-like hydrolase [Lachnospiraceae bacterium]|nr:haloacid dehalogenase-like hydrolase [Lachnospiraceae bacterium]